jgi:hypothetical protein
VLDDYRSLEMVHNGSRRVVKNAWKQDKGHFNEWQVWVNAIQQGGQPPIPYEQLIGVTKATFAALESIKSGETVQI